MVVWFGCFGLACNDLYWYCCLNVGFVGLGGFDLFVVCDRIVVWCLNSGFASFGYLGGLGLIGGFTYLVVLFSFWVGCLGWFV